MAAPVSLSSLFDAAEQAAMGGDFAAASRLLGEAARAQEAALGPDHLDLANTLNNLAVAHERCGQLDEAEREYRRAHAIAARTLPADDPLVTTSAQNLREFCEANGRRVDTPPPAAAAPPADPFGDAVTLRMAAPVFAPASDPPTAPIEPLALTFGADGEAKAPAAPRSGARQTGPSSTTPAAGSIEPLAIRAASAAAAPAKAAQPSSSSSASASAPPPRATPAKAPAPGPATASAPARPTAAARADATPAPLPRRGLSIPMLVALGAIAVLVIWLLAGRGPAAPQATAPEAASAPPPVTSTARPAPAAAAPSVARSPSRSASAPSPTPAASAATPVAAAADGSVSVGEARLCTTLSGSYRCDPAGATVRPGPLVFYTRLVATRDTSVAHRWYRGDQLRQTIRLDVPARRQGFRTFSRGTVSATDGEWRVELRTRDGQLLHAERFTVR